MEDDRIITDPLPIKDAAKMLIFFRLLHLIEVAEQRQLGREDLNWVKDIYGMHLRAERPGAVITNNRLEIRCTNAELDAILDRELVRRNRTLDAPKPSNGNGNGKNGNGNGKHLGVHPPGVRPAEDSKHGGAGLEG